MSDKIHKALQPTPVVAPDEEECQDCLKLLQERDELEERLDKLAEAVSEHFEVPIGEHSSANDPIEVAFDILNGGYKTKYDAPVVVSQDDWESGFNRCKVLAMQIVDEHPGFLERIEYLDPVTAHPTPLPAQEEKQMYTEEAAHLAEKCSEWFEGKTGKEMAAHIAEEIRSRITPLPAEKQVQTFEDWWARQSGTIYSSPEYMAKRAWTAAQQTPVGREETNNGK